MNEFPNQDQLARQVQTLRGRLHKMAKALRAARALSENDALTGLPNRRYLEHEIRRSLHRASRYQQPMALLLLDLDQFKSINDQNGHAVGDALLRDIGNFLAANVRVGDILGRWGGDEFIIVLPQADVDEASGLARRLGETLHNQFHPEPIGKIHLTISIGIAISQPVNATTIDPARLLARADYALYEAKRVGGNTCRLAPQESITTPESTRQS